MPGGGFIGGLLAALAVIVTSLAYSPQYVYNKMKLKPEFYIAVGLSLVLLSSAPSIFNSMSLMKGYWLSISMPVISELKIGTPLIFDAGVFFIVVGVTLSLYFTLSSKK
jgi:multicomponent Na+:H+ antiporter subunit B